MGARFLLSQELHLPESFAARLLVRSRQHGNIDHRRGSRPGGRSIGHVAAVRGSAVVTNDMAQVLLNRGLKTIEGSLARPVKK